MNIKGLWEYDEYREQAEQDIETLEDKVEYLAQRAKNAEAELDEMQECVDFLRERNTILEKQVQKLTDEAKVQKNAGSCWKWVWSQKRGEYIQVLQVPSLETMQGGAKNGD